MTATPDAVAQLGEMIRTFLTDGPVTAESVSAAVTAAKTSEGRFYTAAILDTSIHHPSRPDLPGGFLFRYLSDTYDAHRSKAGV